MTYPSLWFFMNNKVSNNKISVVRMAEKSKKCFLKKWASPCCTYNPSKFGMQIRRKIYWCSLLPSEISTLFLLFPVYLPTGVRSLAQVAHRNLLISVELLKLVSPLLCIIVKSTAFLYNLAKVYAIFELLYILLSLFIFLYNGHFSHFSSKQNASYNKAV